MCCMQAFVLYSIRCCFIIWRIYLRKSFWDTWRDRIYKILDHRLFSAFGKYHLNDPIGTKLHLSIDTHQLNPNIQFALPVGIQIFLKSIDYFQNSSRTILMIPLVPCLLFSILRQPPGCHTTVTAATLSLPRCSRKNIVPGRIGLSKWAFWSNRQTAPGCITLLVIQTRSQPLAAALLKTNALSDL